MLPLISSVQASSLLHGFVWGAQVLWGFIRLVQFSWCTCLFTCFACSFAWSNMFDMVFYMFIHGWHVLWHVLWHVPACTWYSMDIILLISTQRILKIGSSRLRHANMTCIHCKHNIYMNMNMTIYMHVTYTLADHGHNASCATTCWNEGPRLKHGYQGLFQDM